MVLAARVDDARREDEVRLDGAISFEPPAHVAVVGPQRVHE